MRESSTEQRPCKDSGSTAYDLIFRGGCIVEDMVRKDKNRMPNMHLTDIATSCCARDYKGISNWTNGVLEIWKKRDV